MNRTQINQRLKPTTAIIVLSSGGEYSKEYYLEQRNIKTVGDKYRFMAPTPLSQSTIKKLVNSFNKTKFPEMDFGGMIDEHLLYCLNKGGNTVVLWYRPAMARSLNFSGSMAIKGDCMVRVPATLYLVINNKLYIYALQTNERPTAKTKLYHAPYFNIYEDGNVCLGTAPIGRVKGKTFSDEAARFERAFYMAEQNGSSHKPCNTDLRKLWGQLIKKPQAFPGKRELKQQTKYKTLGDLFQKLIYPAHGKKD